MGSLEVVNWVYLKAALFDAVLDTSRAAYLACSRVVRKVYYWAASSGSQMVVC